MGKQTMGTPSTAIRHRTDNKLYYLQTGQSPIVRPELHNTYAMDSFPNGTNAVVAVISYTGYDMEDAMILNKSAHERGFGYGTVYKSQIVDLKDVRGATKSSAVPTVHFGIGRDVRMEGEKAHTCGDFLEKDGLPMVGMRVSSGDPIAAYIDEVSGRTRFVKYKGDEGAYIDSVRLLGTSVHSARSPLATSVNLIVRQQVPTPATPSCKNCISRSVSPVRLSSATSSPRDTGRRVSVPRNGQQSTCRSRRVGSSLT